MPKAKPKKLTDAQMVERIRDLIDQAEITAFDKFFRGADNKRPANLKLIEDAYLAFIDKLFPAGNYCPPGTTLKGKKCVPN